MALLLITQFFCYTLMALTHTLMNTKSLPPKIGIARHKWYLNLSASFLAKIRYPLLFIGNLHITSLP